MNAKTILGSIVFLMLLLIVAGCTQPAASQATPAPTPEATTAVPATSATAVPTTFVHETPGPTQTLQATWAVEVAANSNGKAIDPEVVFTFNGGLGMNYIPEIDVQVTRSDGVVENGKFVQGDNMNMGQTISLPGTTSNNDRAEVWVITPQGDRVKIVDKYVPFRSYS